MYEGLLFIKSMMSINNVMKQAVEDQAYAFKVGIECNDVAVDDGVGIDNSKKEDAICEIESRIKMFKPKEQEYLTSACLIFIDGYEARKEEKATYSTAN